MDGRMTPAPLTVQAPLKNYPKKLLYTKFIQIYVINIHPIANSVETANVVNSIQRYKLSGLFFRVNCAVTNT